MENLARQLPNCAAPSAPGRATAFPRLLYICDFPPSNTQGGDILMFRLLQDYPADKITQLCSPQFVRIARQPLLDAPLLTFPAPIAAGRFARAKVVLQWLLLPLTAVYAAALLWRRGANTILTVAHGRFFIAAAIAGRLTRTPYVVVVHDDWVGLMRKYSRLMFRIAPPIFRWVLQHAAHVYAVSPAMQRMLREQYGVESEIQYPCTDALESAARIRVAEQRITRPVLVYSGMWTFATADTLDLVARVIADDERWRELGIAPELHLYTWMECRPSAPQWSHKRVFLHDWIPAAELKHTLRSADIVVLPFSFDDASRFSVEVGFPSKSADYLASGTPILVIGPAYSSIVKYANEQDFGIVVDRPDAAAIVEAIRQISTVPALRRELSARSGRVFERNHNVARVREQFRTVLANLSDGARGDS